MFAPVEGGRVLSGILLVPWLALAAAPQEPPPGGGTTPGAGPAPPESAADPPLRELPFPSEALEEARRYLESANGAVERALHERRQVVADIEAAIAQFKRAAELAPAEPYPWYRIAQVCDITLSYATALEAAGKAVALKPDSAEILVLRAETLANLHRWKEAEKDWNRAQELSPRSALPHIGRARWLKMRDRKFEEATQELEEALKKDPGNPQAKSLLKRVRTEAKFPDTKDWPAGGGARHESARYIVMTNAEPAAAKFFSAHAERIYAYYTTKFPKVPGGTVKFPIYIFKDEGSFLRGTQAPRAAGYYSPDTRKLVLYIMREDVDNKTAKNLDEKYANTILVLYHEAFHQFLHTHLEDSPRWFDEGHGDFFGGAHFAPGSGLPTVGPNLWRAPYMKAILEQGDQTPFPKLLQLTMPEMYGHGVIENYTQGWSFVHYLWSDPTLFKQYLKPYLEGLQAGKGIGELYRELFEKVDWPSLEVKWRAHCRSLVSGEKK
ncbi:MAG: hypothetical protein L0216_15755 [Planctomycetales bacterium]|nr:hypothetical protein [Planctomycetales bacterium]